MKIIKTMFKENPVFVLALGLCSTLAVTTDFESSYMLGICVTFVLTCSNTIISLIKTVIPKSIKIPTFVLIIGTFVTITELLLKAYLPALAETFGVYLPLIVVNCIVLGRAISVAEKESVVNSFKDGIGIGLGYTLSIALIGLIRELLGTGTITIMSKITPLTGYIAVYKVIPETTLFPMSLFTTPSGAFITIGLLFGIINFFKKEEK